MKARLWQWHVRLGELRQRITRRTSDMRYVAHSWPLRPAQCPCDVDFCEYLDSHNIRGQRVFHLGTGGHHLVGQRNHAAQWNNEILGLTISPREHARYVKLAIRDPALAARYKVLFGDLHALAGPMLPEFDVVTLFHLGEFSDATAAGRRLDDMGVLRLFAARLSPGGRILFYRRSFAFGRVTRLLDAMVADGTLAHAEDFRSLLVYRRTAARERA